MKIGVDARPLRHPHSGIGRYTIHLLERMTRESGHSWYLYQIDESEALHCGWLARKNIVCRRAASKVPVTLAAQWLFPRWAREDSLDVFWTPRHHLPRSMPPPVSVVTIHDFVWRVVPETMPVQRRLTERLLMARSIRSADRIICTSNAIAKELGTLYPPHGGKVNVIPMASTLQFADVTPPSDPPYALFVGVDPRKDLGSAMAGFGAFAQMPGAGGCELHVVGAVTRQEAPQSVRFLGNLSDQALAMQFAGCRCLLFPSRYEGFGLPIVEAFAAGKPAIVADTPVGREVAGAGALFVRLGDAVGIADGLASLMLDDTEWRVRAAAACARQKRFSWDRSARQTFSVLVGDVISQVPTSSAM